jgi:hypothetical protein
MISPPIADEQGWSDMTTFQTSQEKLSVAKVIAPWNGRTRQFNYHCS